jgi:UrcA family protein
MAASRRRSQAHKLACLTEIAMNSATTFLLSPVNLPILACAVAVMALHANASLAADGQQSSVPALEKRLAVVSLADLDTSTPQGAQAARERLRATARRLCSQLQDSWDLGHQPHFVACVEGALQRALHQLTPPAVATAEHAHRAEHTAP